MIQAVFFDWFNTLARFEPSREAVQTEAYSEFGIKLNPNKLTRGILQADREYFEADNRKPVVQRTPREQLDLAINYQQTVLADSHVAVELETHVKILGRIRTLYATLKFAQFEDAEPVLQKLKAKKYILGLLTNADKDMVSSGCGGLGQYMDFVVTSTEVGANKPAPPMFLRALELVQVAPAQAIHVGDQYHLDVVGARGVGIAPVLLDRNGFYNDVKDCPVIHNLPEIFNYLPR